MRRFQVLEPWLALTLLEVLGLVSWVLAADFASRLLGQTEQGLALAELMHLASAVQIVVLALIAEAQELGHYAAAAVAQVHQKVLAGVEEESVQVGSLDPEEDTTLEALRMEAYQDNLRSLQVEVGHGNLDLADLWDPGPRTAVVGIGCIDCRVGREVVVGREAGLDLGEGHFEE